MDVFSSFFEKSEADFSQNYINVFQRRVVGGNFYESEYEVESLFKQMICQDLQSYLVQQGRATGTPPYFSV